MTKNETLWIEALRYLPGGVNSPVRACGPVGAEPIFAVKGEGPHIWDADGNKYIDYVCSWGALLLGHAFPDVVRSVRDAAVGGSTFGMPTPWETELAKLAAGFVPSVEKLRLVNSGTEATMSAVRLARGATGRNKIVKFEGCYHGHVDSLLVRAGSGALTLSIPGTPGVPVEHVAHTLIAPFNDAGAVEDILSGAGEDVACIIVEPVAGNMGVVPPKPGFLEDLRSLATDCGCLLIFDEVMTGFRLARGGYQEVAGVTPDLTTMGKVLGGGLPLGAFGGPAALMDELAPLGPVYQAGTLSGNPLAVAAGTVTLKQLEDGAVYGELEKAASRLERGLRECAADALAPTSINRAGSMITLFFAEEEITGYRSACAADAGRYGAFFRAMRSEGVNLPPSQFEAWFVSAAHTEDEIDRTVEAARSALRSVK
jgi:glutamate-1-semialdehyde 2,1-aminomutase